MQITLNIENESVAQKILWLLDHFKKDGLDIKNESFDKNKISDNSNEYSDEYIQKNWESIISDGLKDIDDN